MNPHRGSGATPSAGRFRCPRHGVSCFRPVLPGRPRKRFDIYRTSADVQYRIMRWLYAGAEYEFISKQAGNDRYQLEEYDDHVITLLLTAKL